MALRRVDRESEAEGVRFHRRRVTKVGQEVKHRRIQMPVSFLSADQRTQYGDYAGTNGRAADAVLPLE